MINNLATVTPFMIFVSKVKTLILIAVVNHTLIENREVSRLLKFTIMNLTQVRKMRKMKMKRRKNVIIKMMINL